MALITTEILRWNFNLVCVGAQLRPCTDRSGRYDAQLLRLEHVCPVGIGSLPARCRDYHQPVNGGPVSFAFAEMRPAQETHYTTHLVLPSLTFWQWSWDHCQNIRREFCCINVKHNRLSVYNFSSSTQFNNAKSVLLTTIIMSHIQSGFLAVFYPSLRTGEATSDFYSPTHTLSFT